MFTVEVAKLSDIERLIDLLTLLFSQEAEFVPARDIQRIGLQAILEDQNIGTIFVLKNKEKIIGMVSLLWTISTALGGRVAFLEDMVVDIDWRGRGGGHMLVEYAIAYSKNLTCKRITLLTDIDNLAAHRFYQQFGFQTSVMQPMRLILSDQ
ncbi:GNAT family N-acetyltransferase [Sulfurospirillum diekertiae]|uniref:Aminoalkylphosphonate N-acetyltransferase n=1 Tax=Sulfurospirillum diekertiae TaxID=1854492 RepID=A0A1Y0HIJ7_9BACT|nr:GNAT family N-acetyltransferase [Sulfurospirillum diekertiae]ARU47780.1 Aminoalkylphosphonate N-acetyltransferase [Sulfurospirillum diekertiae]ASC92626.1 Aminoalkylphosphonate N-acetyltransferase [Sulfurospirillum diekertiae]